MAWFALDCRDIVPTLVSWWFRLVVNCSPSNPFHMIDCFSVNYRPKATSQPTIRWMMKYHQKAWTAISPNSCWTTANGQPLHNCHWNCAKPSMFFDFVWRLVAERQLLQIWSTQIHIVHVSHFCNRHFPVQLPRKMPIKPPQKKTTKVFRNEGVDRLWTGPHRFCIAQPKYLQGDFRDPAGYT